MTIAIRRPASAVQALRNLPIRNVDRALAWLGVANAVIGALKPRRKLIDRWSSSRSGTRDVVAVAAGVAAVALIAYAARRHYLSQRGGEPLSVVDRRTRASLAFQVSPRELYDTVTHPERVASIFDSVESATVVSAGHWRWLLRGSAGSLVPMDIEVVDDAPGSLIAWRTAGTPFAHHGVIAFQPLDQGKGTLLEVEIEHDAGEFGTHAAKTTESTLRQELKRLKQFLETGEVATTSGQPVGGRSLMGSVLTRGES